MVNFPGRQDRRRRVLKEEVLSTSGARTARRSADTTQADDAPRYSDAAGVENHPQVTDFVPRRYSTIALLVVSGAVLATASAAAHYFLLPVAAAHGMDNGAFDLASRGSLASWLAAVVMFVASGFCVMTYSLRRHRIDDFRGRYRVWMAAAFACLALSVNSVAGLHQVLADFMGQVTGYSALRNGAVWWLALAGLPIAWILVRVLVDVRECRVAAGLLVGSAVSFAASATSYFGFGPAVEARIQPVLTAAPLLMGFWLLFAAIVANARFVVLDAQGLVTVRRRASAKRSSSRAVVKSSPKLAVQTTGSSSPSSSTSSAAAIMALAAKRPADSSQWLDGTRPERKHYDEDDEDESSDGERKLSKADRKRLRKLKTEGHAA